MSPGAPAPGEEWAHTKARDLLRRLDGADPALREGIAARELLDVSLGTRGRVLAEVRRAVVERTS